MTTLRTAVVAAAHVELKDSSVRKAFERLDAHGGPVSAASLRSAILHGTGDKDSRAATVEYADVMRWAKANQSRLTAESRKVLAVFARFAKAARAEGRTGIPVARVNQMASMMTRVVTGQTARRPEPKVSSHDGFTSGSRSGAESVVHDSRNKWFISQYDSKWNTNEDAARNGNCGPTSILMAANAFGKVHVTPGAADRLIEDARRRAGAGTNEYRGISVDTMARGVRSYGLNTHVENNSSLADIKRELSKGRLVMLNVSPTYYSNQWRNGGHMTIVTAIKDGKVYLNDPGTTRGPKVISEAEFMRAVRRRQEIAGSLGSPQGMVSVWK